VKSLLLALLVAAPAASCEGSPQARYVAADSSEFPRLSGRVVDEADLLTKGEEQALTDRLAALERDVRAQFVVVTVRSLRGRPVEDYAVDLARLWGIGSKSRDDGLVLLVAPNERKIRVEVGKGLEHRVTDPFAGEVIRNIALPSFSRGELDRGIIATSDALIARLRSRETEGEIARKDHLVV
jgi:uncharacterized protein